MGLRKLKKIVDVSFDEICHHNYACTCLDSILHTTVCKHVHLVHMKYMQKDINSISEDTTLLTDTYSYCYLTRNLTHL